MRKAQVGRGRRAFLVMLKFTETSLQDSDSLLEHLGPTTLVLV